MGINDIFCSNLTIFVSTADRHTVRCVLKGNGTKAESMARPRNEQETYSAVRPR